MSQGFPILLIGNQDFCVDNTINICFEGVSSEALMLSSKNVLWRIEWIGMYF